MSQPNGVLTGVRAFCGSSGRCRRTNAVRTHATRRLRGVLLRIGRRRKLHGKTRYSVVNIIVLDTDLMSLLGRPSVRLRDGGDLTVWRGDQLHA